MKKHQLVLAFILSVLFLSSCDDNIKHVESNNLESVRINGYMMEKVYTKIDGCEYLVLMFPQRVAMSKLDCNCIPNK